MTPTIDFHTHKAECASDTICVRSCRAGRDPLPVRGIYTVGVHPWDVSDPDSVGNIRAIKHLNPSAIGEIGLDYAIDSDRERQKTIFEAHLELAAELRKPVIIHCVRAFEDVMKILSGYKNIDRIAFHGYTGSPEQTARLIAAGYYASFGEILFRSPKTQKSFTQMPLNKIFLETDDGDADVADIYTKAADILNVGSEELRTVIYDNFKTFFGL